VLFRRALSILDAEPQSNPTSVAISVLHLAELYRVQGRYEEAEPFYQRALALLEKVRGREHPELLGTLTGYAALLRKTGRKAEAKQLDDRAEAIRAAMKKQREEASRHRKDKQQ
jgi:tetratricopeptide (TPR) repeat protein